MELRYKFHGAPDDPVKSNHSRTAAMLELLKVAFQAHSQCFVFSILDIGSRKPREICEHGFLALHGLLSSKLEKPSMWKNMKAALRRGNLDSEELNLRKEAVRLKSDDAHAFITSYAERATETIPTAHVVKGKINIMDDLVVKLIKKIFIVSGNSSTGVDEEDGAGVLEFENALNFWREYVIESELEEKAPERLAGLDTFKRILEPFVKDGKIRFTGCKGFQCAIAQLFLSSLIFPP